MASVEHTVNDTFAELTAENSTDGSSAAVVIPRDLGPGQTTFPETRFEESSDRPTLPTGKVVARIPVRTTKPSRFTLLRRWEGVVEQVDGDVVVARLSAPDAPSELVEFDFCEIAPDDRDLVAPGAVFYWTIGRQRELGAVQNVSEIRFRRLPAWSWRDLQQAERRAAELSASLFSAEPERG